MADMTRAEKEAAAKAKWLSSLSREEKIALAQQKWAAENPQPSSDSLPEQLETGIRAALSSASLGLSEPVVSGGIALKEAAKERLFGPEGQEPTALSELYAKDVAAREALKEKYPTTELIGQVAGAFSPVGPAAAAFKGAQAIGKTAAGALPIAKTLAGQIAGAGLGAGVSQALESKIKEETGFQKPGSAPSALEAAKTGATTQAMLSAIPIVGKTAAGIGKGALTVFTGVRPTVINRVLENSEEAFNAKSLPEIRDLAQKTVDDIKKAAVSEQLNLTDEIQRGLETLKSKVIQESALGYEVLNQSGKKFGKNEIIAAIQSAKKPYEKVGIVGEAARTAKDKIDNLIKEVSTLPDEVDGSVLKNILKSIDESVEYLQKPGTFVKDPTQRVLSTARRSVDDMLKTAIPEYADVMKRAHSTADLLEESAKLFQDEKKTFNVLTQLGKPKSPIQNQQAQKFFQEANVDPERFRQAQENAELFKTWEGSSLGAKIDSLAGDKFNVVREQWKKLAELNGETDFIKQIEAAKDMSAFEQSFIRGSRNVLLWTALGVGATGGLDTLFMAGAGGSVIGAVMDQFGPKGAKAVLKGVTSIKGIPTVQKIRSLNLTNKQKEWLVDGFVRAVGQAKDETFTVSPESKASFHSVINESNLGPVEKAKKLTQLNKTGEVSGIKQIMVGKEKPNPAFEPTDYSKEKNKSVTLDDVSSFVEKKKMEQY